MIPCADSAFRCSALTLTFEKVSSKGRNLYTDDWLLLSWLEPDLLWKVLTVLTFSTMTYNHALLPGATFVGSGWGVVATKLRIATLALVHSTVEYCVPVWCRSARTRLFGPAIHNALQTVTRFLRPTPADNLPILAGIQPVELCSKGATLSLARRAMEPGHQFHSAFTCQLSTEWECTTSQIETSISHAARQRSVHPPTTSEVRLSWRITDGMLSGWTTLRDFVLSCQAPSLPEWPFREQRAFSLIPSAPVSDISAPAHTNSVWPIRRLWVWRRTSRRPYCPRMSNPSTSPWTARATEWLLNTCGEV